LIVSTPNKWTQGYNENPYHIREFSPQELKQILSKYFPKVTLFGLYGDTEVNKYEKLRKRQVLKILNLDFLRLRRFLPRSVKIFLFEYFIPKVRKTIFKENIKLVVDISEKNFFVFKKTKKAIDLIALCQK